MRNAATCREQAAPVGQMMASQAKNPWILQLQSFDWNRTSSEDCIRCTLPIPTLCQNDKL
eukprot:6211243-Pleurochrysis_carterae.AAC.1